MNKRQKEIIKNELKNEKTVMNQIEAVYHRALIDIEKKIDKMQARIDKDMTDTAAIYQKRYQEALKKQISAILDMLNANQYEKIQDYLEQCYVDAFIGNIYDLHGQGIPVITPINQENVTKAIQHDTKLSKPLYEALGYNVEQLKKTIAGEISRGIATGMMYAEIARNIRNSAMVSMRKAMTIARTEGHRIQEEARHESRHKAKETGADIVKQWDSTLDKRTRPTHQKLDGQIRELDEPFKVNGMKAMYPSGFGKAKEDINCRCIALQRAKWALDEEELNTMKERAKYFKLDKTKDFDDFKGKYLKSIEEMEKSGTIQLDLQFFASKEKQFGKKIGKHAKDYGLDPSKETDREKMHEIINDIVDNYDEIRSGTWRGQENEVDFYIKGEDVVVRSKEKEFITILKGGVNNARVKNARNK